jgi:hypothetical protein
MRLNFDMDRGQYTQQLSDLIWEQYSAENSFQDDYCSVLDVLRDSTVFRPFSDRILCFINELYGTEYSNEEAAKVVLKKSTECGVKLNRNTVLNWFSGKTQPKKGQPDRERMFALAFLLSLGIPKTIELFQKVLLERAYNLRNINDFVYLFGQLHEMSYTETMALIEKAETTLVSETEESINDTQQLLDDLAALPGEKSLLEYIASHSRAFSIGQSSAKSEYIRLLFKAKDDLSGREYRKRIDSFDNSIITSMEGRTQGSLDFMLYVIKGQDWLQTSETDSSLFKSLFSYEISNDFPDRSTLNDNVTSSYILRKNIIFLSFYIYWVQMYLEGDKYGIDECDCYDEFRSSINKRLMDCGLSPLYTGNPYDWLFLYCSAAATDPLTPLDIFRGIMAT